MRDARLGSRGLRGAGLLLLGALALHSLRYLIAYGPRAQAELSHQGHSYLAELLPGLLAVAVALIASAALLRVVGGGNGRSAGSLRTGLVAYALALLAIYSSQELAEGLLAPGHAGGVEGLLGEGGWIALPIALVLGWALVLGDRWLHRAEERLYDALIQPGPQPGAGPPVLVPANPFVRRTLALLLGFGFSRRPPPGLLST